MKCRELITDSGKKVLAGKNAEQNEEIVKEFEGKSNVILHTAAPGSPFCVIENLRPNKKDIKKAAIFCAKKSQDWRDNKNDVLIHVFTGKDVYKRKRMKMGMFGVKKFEVIKIKKKEIENFKC